MIVKFYICYLNAFRQGVFAKIDYRYMRCAYSMISISLYNMIIQQLDDDLQYIWDCTRKLDRFI